MVQITEKGKSQNSTLNLKDIENSSNFLDFYVQEKDKHQNGKITEIQNSSPQDLIDQGFTEIENQVKSEKFSANPLMKKHGKLAVV